MGLIGEVYDECWRQDITRILESDKSDLSKLKEIGKLVDIDYLELEWSKPKEQDIIWSAIK